MKWIISTSLYHIVNETIHEERGSHIALDSTHARRINDCYDWNLPPNHDG